MLSHENFVSTIACLKLNTEIPIGAEDVHLSYLPLPHVFERLLVTAMLANGGSIAFYSGDVLKLKDDISVVKPTIFASVPRLYNKFYDGIKGNMAKVTGVKKYLVDTAVSTKLANLEKDASYTH
jgi:long-chain acyl-CoA synthetase